MIQNFRQKRNKKKYKRNQLNFKTPPPNPNYTTIDPNLQNGFHDTSFQGFSEEPEISVPQKQNINMLKASISKLSIDFAQDRQFLESLKKKYNRNQFNQFGGSPFIKSVDAFSFDQNDSKLPSIKQSISNRNNIIKSPVMESIRVSRNTKAGPFASLQKFRPGAQSFYDGRNSDDEKSEGSDRSNIRTSYVAKRTNKANMSMNKGMFFVHKGENKGIAKQKADGIARASTYLQNSMIFNSKSKRRDSKNAKGVKASGTIDRGVENFKNKRKSKTFIDSKMIRNKLATISKIDHSKNKHQSGKFKKEDIENDLSQHNALVSMKSIGSFNDQEEKRPSTKAKTNEFSNEVHSGEAVMTECNYEEESSDKLNRTLSNFSPESK